MDTVLLIDTRALIPIGGERPPLLRAEINRRRVMIARTWYDVPAAYIVAQEPALFALTARGELKLRYDAHYPDGTLEQLEELTWTRARDLALRWAHHWKPNPRTASPDIDPAPDSPAEPRRSSGYRW